MWLSLVLFDISVFSSFAVLFCLAHPQPIGMVYHVSLDVSKSGWLFRETFGLLNISSTSLSLALPSFNQGKLLPATPLPQPQQMTLQPIRIQFPYNTKGIERKKVLTVTT